MPRRESPSIRSRISSMLLVASGVSILAAFASTLGLSVTRAQEPTASKKTQGSGITIVLAKDFIDKYANRATIKTDFRVDAVSKVHPASKDGEVHIGGVAVEAKLAAVAELTNPDPPM